MHVGRAVIVVARGGMLDVVGLDERHRRQQIVFRRALERLEAVDVAGVEGEVAIEPQEAVAMLVHPPRHVARAQMVEHGQPLGRRVAVEVGVLLLRQVLRDRG